MSKSTGNFMTLDDSIRKYGADATRVAIADSGDTMADSNFSEDVADSSILRLYTLKEWCEELAKSHDLRDEINDFEDAQFENEMHAVIHESRKHYEETNYKLALKTSFYDFCNAKDFYRAACEAAGIPMNKSLAFKYMKLQALALAPIAPHWSEYIWLDVLKETKTIQLARWPEVPAADASISAARAYVQSTQSKITSEEGAALKKLAKGKQSSYDPKKPKKVTIFVAKVYPQWQTDCLQVLIDVWDPTTNTQKISDKELSARIAKLGLKPNATMPFMQAIKKPLQDGQPIETLTDRKLAFNEAEIIVKMVPGLKERALLSVLDVVLVSEGTKKGIDLLNGGEVDVTSSKADEAIPGQPSFEFGNVKA